MLKRTAYIYYTCIDLLMMAMFLGGSRQRWN